MGSLNRRIRKLEGGRKEPGEEWVIPPEVQVYTKAVERYQARKNGEIPPPYSQEEIAELRQSDLESAVGGGVVGEYRNSKGWQSEEARATLDAWERDARRRVEAAKDLPPERWDEVWGGVM